MQTYEFLIKEETLLTQKTFRVILSAMSHPGRLYSIDQKIRAINIPEEFNGLFLILLTLLDHEVGFCVIGKEKENLKNIISEITSCSLKDISDADFIIVSGGESGGEILKANRGTLDYPDKGATLIYFLNSISLGDNGRERITLKGPGINGEIALYLGEIKKDELHYLREINSEYPLGVDSIFVDRESRIMCIPRSTKIIL